MKQGLMIFAASAALILGGTLSVFVPADAQQSTHLDIASSTVTTHASTQTADVSITTGADIPEDGGAFGYGLIFLNADGTLDTSAIAVSTTHPGVQDSEAQQDRFDAIFHTHYVSLAPATHAGCADGAFQVTGITWQEPAAATEAGGTAVTMDAVPRMFTGEFSLDRSVDLTFDVREKHVGKTVSFTIKPVDADGNVNAIGFEAVCIEDVSLADPLVVMPSLSCR